MTETALSPSIPADAPRPAMLDLARHPLAALLAVEATEEGVSVVFDDGQWSLFHALWLRDNCPCPACRHPQTLERRYLLVEAPEALAVASTNLLPGGHLEVAFSDGHLARFDAGWLKVHAYDETARQARRREPRLWRAGHRPVTLPHQGVMTGDAGLTAFLQGLLSDGLVVLRGGPAVPEEVLHVARRIGEPRGSNFGLFFEVLSQPNPIASAYTAMGLELHSDLANWAWPPDYQLLYCLANEAAGGDSLLADGLAVAAALKDEDPEAYDILARVPVAFRFHDETCDIRFSAPTIETDAGGCAVAVRFNNWLRAALEAPPTEVTAWYRAYRRFWSLLREPAFRLTLRLEPGEMLAFDNRRVLHGRTPYDSNAGRRHLQGTYLSRDDVESRLRLLERKEA